MTTHRVRFLCVVLAVFAAVSLGVQAGDDLVNLSFDGVDYAHIFQTLGRLQGLNVLVDPSAAGQGTFELENLSFREALNLVAGFGGFDYRIIGNTLVVASPEKLRQINRLDVEAVRFFQIEHAKPSDIGEALRLIVPQEQMYIQPERGLVILLGAKDVLEQAEEIIAVLDKPSVQAFLQETAPEGAAEPTAAAAPKYQLRVYRLNYAEPETVLSALSMIIDESRMRLDPESKGIIVRATADELAEVEAFLADIDQPIPQVVLEVWVQEMTADALRNLGIDWKGIPSFEESTAPVFLELEWKPWDLVLALRLLEEKGDAKLLANPKITTLSGQTATIFVGDRVPVVLTDEEGRTTMEFLESGINLQVTPRISEDEYITILVEPEVSTFIWRADTQYPQIRTREAQTTVRVKDGQPFVLGGLLQEQDNEAIKGIPFLSQLPILGQLFQWKETKHTQTEMTIFLIPRIVTDEEEVAYTDFFTPTQ